VAFAEIVAPAYVESGVDTRPAWAVEIATARGLTVRLRSPLAPTVLARLLREARC
jgi:hypothetical protein